MNAKLVHQLLERQADARPETALVVEGRTHATYAEIDQRANAMAHVLLGQGVERGDRIGLLAINSVEYIVGYYGILKAGAVAVSCNASANDRSCRELLGLCEARGLICGRRMGRRAGGVEELAHIEFVIGRESEWDERLARTEHCRLVDPSVLDTVDQNSPKVAIAPWDRAAIIYTSGSTGRPKGATLRHSNIVANTRSIVQYLQLTPFDRVMVVLPFHYVYGKSLLNTHVAAGGSVVLENGFLFPQRALDTLERSECTGFSGVPSTFAILLNRSNIATREFPHLRYVTQAGGAMAPELQRRLIEALPGKQIFIMYGATEASARLAYLPPEDLQRKIGSIGKAIPGVELRVTRADGSEADVQEVGELVAQGGNIMEGYWRDVEGTASVLDQHGYHTGDLAYRDDDGFLFVVGRSREMIKSGAHRIAPKEIEDILQEHPSVHEAAVVGVPDEILGECIAAFISTRSSVSLNEKEVINWCRQRLPAYKVPRLLRVIEDFERNASGKINKLVLANRVDGCDQEL